MLQTCTWLVAASVWAGQEAPTNDVYLSDLGLGAISQGWGMPERCRSIDSLPLRIGGRTYREGIGTHAVSQWYLRVDGKATMFSAVVGVDDETKGQGSVEFLVMGDDRVLARSGILRARQTFEFKVPLAGISRVGLLVSEGRDGGGYDHADWCDAKFTMQEKARPINLYPRPKPEDKEWIYPIEYLEELPNWPEITLPLQFILTRDDDGTNGSDMSIDLIPGILKELNQLFRPTHVRFTCDPDRDVTIVQSTILNRDFAPDNNVYTDRNQQPPKRKLPPYPGGNEPFIARFPGQIPVLCHRGSNWEWNDDQRRWIDQPAGGGVGGATVLISGVAGPSLLAHEMGHTLGLGHTFGPYPKSEEEAAGFIRKGIEQKRPADQGLEVFHDHDSMLFGDVPADPGADFFPGRKEFKEWPRRTIHVTLKNSEAREYEAKPDPFNIMSYFPEGGAKHPKSHEFTCRFSPNQFRILRTNLVHWRDDMGSTAGLSPTPAGTGWSISNLASSGFSGKRMKRPSPTEYEFEGRQIPVPKTTYLDLATKPGDKIHFAVPVKAGGRFTPWWSGGSGPANGLIDIQIDGKKVGEFDEWKEDPVPTGWRRLETLSLTPGIHRLTVIVAGRNKLSKGSQVTLDRLILQPITSPAS